MKQIVMGTAGHIDHGKTALIKALTGIDCDRLKEEKERGITIDLGFAYLPLDDEAILGIVDVPGHERFVRNMLAGAAGIDFVLLVIAADEGVMPQTREHLAICQLLRIKDGLIAITKKDLVEPDWLDLVIEETRDFIKGSFLAGCPIVPVSSRTGEGVEELKRMIAQVAARVPARQIQGTFRLPIDRVFTIKGFGTVVTGTTHTGRIGLDSMVTIYPRGLTARVRGIQVHGKQVKEAIAGQRTALNLQGVGKDEIERGDVVSVAGGLSPSHLVNASLYLLPEAPRPLKNRTRIRFHHGTSEIIGRVLLLDREELSPGEETYVQFYLERPLVALPKDYYVIRSYSPILTIGGGQLLEITTRKVRSKNRQEIKEHLGLLDRGEDAQIVEYHILQAGGEGLRPADLLPRTHLSLEQLRELFGELAKKKILTRVSAEEERFIHQTAYQSLKDQLMRQLDDFHTKFPLKLGVQKEELKSRSLIGEDRLFIKLLNELRDEGRIIIEGDRIRSASHTVRLGDRQEELKREIEQEFYQARFQPPDPEKVYERLSIKDAENRQLINILLEEGKLIRIKGNIYYHEQVLKEIEQGLLEFLKKKGSISPGEFKELFGFSRKYAIPLLEYFDGQKLTMRIGDKRVLRREG